MQLFAKTIIVLAIPSLFLPAHADDSSGVDTTGKLFTVKTRIEGNGSMTPPGNRKVNKNTMVGFTITPNNGHVIRDVKGCGGHIIHTPSRKLYITAPIVANCSMTARFTKVPRFFVVKAIARANGSISPRGKKTVSRGAVLSFTVTPDSGYVIKRVHGCGGKLSGTTYTTAAITDHCNVIAQFKALRIAAEPTLSYVPGKLFRFSWSDVAGATSYRLMENPDGASGFSQVGGDIAPGTGVFDHYVPLYKRVNAQYMLQSCFNNQCIDSSNVAVSGTLAASIGYFKASNTGTYDYFGSSVHLSGDGNILAVGARGEDSDATGVNGDQSNNSADNSGAVYVFSRDSDNTWTQQAYIKASNTDAGDFFSSVSLSGDGNVLAVGAAREDSDATGVNGDQSNNNADRSGAAYVFSRDSGNTWTQEAYIKASNTDAKNWFGLSTSLSDDGNVLAVGALGESSNARGINDNQSDNNAFEAGAAYVFIRDSGNTWAQQAYIKASNADAEDSFGFSTILSGDGNTLAVGARTEDSDATGVNGDQSDNSAGRAGAVYLY